MLEIYYLLLSDEYEKETFSYLMTFVASNRRDRILRLNNATHKKSSLYAELLVRYIACKHLNVNNDDLTIAYTEFGKPYISGFNNFQYSISHTNNIIVLAISECDVGIDIEKISKADIAICNRFFSKTEKEYVLSDKNHVDERFFEIWTAKEAYLKCIGTGMFIPMKSFDVCSRSISKKIYTIKIENYIISCCSMSMDTGYVISYLKENSLVTYYMKYN